LTKVGDDIVGQNIIDELNVSNVETSSRLFRQGGPGSTTSFTTVIVDEKETTRTCIHTPGTCGELSLVDVQSLSQEEIDQVFRNVIHLHSDSRHTEVSLWMAKEAKKRGIRVSCDCEKDRMTKALDELIEVCDILFTNSNHLGDYLERLTCEREAATGRQPLSKPTITINKEKLTTLGSPSNQRQQKEEHQLIETYAKSLTPSVYFSRWQHQPAIGKEVVVTHGSMGALHYKQIESSKNGIVSSAASSNKSLNAIDIELEDKNIARIRHSFDDGVEASNILYEVRQTGILKDATVVDTTGAGDAFIGGYILMSSIAFEEGEDEAIGSKVQIALEMGSFVGGRKVGGPGARTALPTGRDIDLLGSSTVDAKASLRNLLGSFNNAQE
jgi:sugar/nucleoside kinase (ribokinase family)